MISSKDMQISKGLISIYDIFVPTSTSVLSKIGLFSGVMPSLIIPPSLTQAMALTPAQFMSDLGIAQAQYLGHINFTSATTRKPVLTNDTVNRKIGVSFSAITTDLIGAVAGTPTFFIAMSTIAASTDVSNYAAWVSGSGVDTIIMGTVGDEDSNAELKLVGGKIVVGQGYRFTDLSLSY